MMATLRRFIAFLLARTMDRARSHVKTGTHFSGSRSKPGILVPVFDLKVPTPACGHAVGTSDRQHYQRAWRPKRKPGPRTGHTLLIAAQYSQKSPENNVLFVAWLADFGGKPAPSGALGLFGRVNPSQHFLEVVFDSLVALAGSFAQCLAIAHHYRTPAGLQYAFRLEGLHDTADIAAPDPKQRGELLMGQRHGVLAIGALQRGHNPFSGALLDRMNRIAGGRLEDLGQHAVGIARKHVIQRG